MMLAAAAEPDKPMLMAGVLLRRVTATAIRDNHQAAGRLRQAEAVHAEVVGRLHQVQLVGYGPTPTDGDVERAAVATVAQADPEARTAHELNEKTKTDQRPPGQGLPPRPLGPANPARPTTRGTPTQPGDPSPGDTPTRGDDHGR